MKSIKIYLSSENNNEPQIIEIDEDSKMKDILIKHHEIFKSPNETIEEFEIFVEDEDDFKHKDDDRHKAGVHKHAHVHCHRCKKISTQLEYNGQVKDISLSPSTTGAKILSLVHKLFPNITEQDALDLRLKLPNGKFLEKTDHLGSFVSYPHCQTRLTLISKPKVQGYER